VVIVVAVLAVTVADMPLKVTEFSESVVLKLVPVMVTGVPSGADNGEKEVMLAFKSAAFRKTRMFM
jgi:hypothetical protein